MAHEQQPWLDVPYAEKDAAKAAGARWDRRARRWYAPRPGMPELARWLPDPQHRHQHRHQTRRGLPWDNGAGGATSGSNVSGTSTPHQPADTTTDTATDATTTTTTDADPGARSSRWSVVERAPGAVVVPAPRTPPPAAPAGPWWAWADDPWDDLALRPPGLGLLAEAARRRELGDSDASWRAGADGEAQLADALAGLTHPHRLTRLTRGPHLPRWRVLHSVPLGPDGRHGDIDHVLIGPPGVITINAKHHAPRRRVDITPDAMSVGGQPVAHIAKARAEADRAHAADHRRRGPPRRLHQRPPRRPLRRPPRRPRWRPERRGVATGPLPRRPRPRSPPGSMVATGTSSPARGRRSCPSSP